MLIARDNEDWQGVGKVSVQRSKTALDGVLVVWIERRSTDQGGVLSMLIEQGKERDG
jgi:hypothetical protein